MKKNTVKLEFKTLMGTKYLFVYLNNSIKCEFILYKINNEWILCDLLKCKTQNQVRMVYTIMNIMNNKHNDDYVKKIINKAKIKIIQ